jgi:hypothetical protein
MCAGPMKKGPQNEHNSPVSFSPLTTKMFFKLALLSDVSASGTRHNLREITPG